MTDSVVKEIRVRLAPSPTGSFHFGTARTALFNWLFARQSGGVFVLRIEDTDTERSEKRYETEVFESLEWLGLHWDEGPDWKDVRGKKRDASGACGPYRQSDRKKIYRAHLSRLLEEKKAYYCYCTKEELEAQRQSMLAQGLPAKYSGHCRDIKIPPKGKVPQVIRFKTPETSVEFKDMIRGKVSFDANLFGDIVIAKGLDAPLYNFAAAIDDEEMKISHVIRGEDHISNTPKQILMQKALGFRELTYAHLPLILGADRSKLSKRYAETSLLEYRNKGFLPAAVVNFLAFLGWHPKDNREIFSLDELVKEFDLKRVQKAGAIFNMEKLEWINAQHIRSAAKEDIAAYLEDFAARGAGSPEIRDYSPIFKDRKFLEKIIEIEKERSKTLADFFELTSFFFALPEYDANLLVWQKETPANAKKNLEAALGILSGIKKKQIDRALLEEAMKDLIEKEGRGPVLWPLRVAVSGRPASPDPLDIIKILGLDESVRRIRTALEKLDTVQTP